MSTEGDDRREDGVSLGRIVVGVILVVAGLVWLLDALGVGDVPLRVILPAALLLVGVALVVGSGTGAHPGLIVLGAVLTVVLTFGSFALPRGSVRGEGVGQRVEAPAGPEELRPTYRLAAGELRLDLTRLDDLRGGRSLRARVGVGRLVVLVPDGLSVEVEAEAGIGQVRVFGRESAGFGAEGRAVRGSGRGRLDLDLSVGMGEVEVLLRPEAREGRLRLPPFEDLERLGREGGGRLPVPPPVTGGGSGG